MNQKTILTVVISAIAMIGFESGVPSEYGYRYDANGNITARIVTGITPMALADDMATEDIDIPMVENVISLKYENADKKVEISVSNPNEEYPITVMVFDGTTNLLIEQHTFTSEKYMIDMSSKRAGIYIITASDSYNISSTKILKE